MGGCRSIDDSKQSGGQVEVFPKLFIKRRKKELVGEEELLNTLFTHRNK